MTVERKIEELIEDALLRAREDKLLVSSEEGLTPIEKLLRGAFLALEIHSSHWLDIKYWPTVTGQMTIEKLYRFPAFNFEDWHVHIFHQVKIGRYVVDFLAFVSIKGDDGKEVRKEWLAIECDGHDFHEKTKDQAAKDKARDRFLTGIHIPVMRFTGSEIWKSPQGCAYEALGYFEEHVCPSVEAA
jgi:very-short-patch-repair endonuclease